MRFRACPQHFFASVSLMDKAEMQYAANLDQLE